MYGKFGATQTMVWGFILLTSEEVVLTFAFLLQPSYRWGSHTKLKASSPVAPSFRGSFPDSVVVQLIIKWLC